MQNVLVEYFNPHFMYKKIKARNKQKMILQDYLLYFQDHPGRYHGPDVARDSLATEVATLFLPVGPGRPWKYPTRVKACFKPSIQVPSMSILHIKNKFDQHHFHYLCYLLGHYIPTLGRTRQSGNNNSTAQESA